MLTNNAAFAHPAYEDGVRNAVQRAASHLVTELECYSVYFDGDAIYVRHSKAAPPANAKLICIAQRWDENTVQLRFDAARSEWRHVGGAKL